MQVRQRQTTEPHRHGAPRRRHPQPREVSAALPAPFTPDGLTDEYRLRDSGGPDDRAFYRCACGTAFRADVTTSVSCPGCGGEQAW
jgi:hypothetical protein